jgi:hypothetical protein
LKLPDLRVSRVAKVHTGNFATPNMRFMAEFRGGEVNGGGG